MAFSPFSGPIKGRSAPSLHQRFLVTAGIGGGIIVLLLAVAANQLLTRNAEQQGNLRLIDAAGRAQIIVSEALSDRARQAKVLSLAPQVVAAAKEGGARARSLGIVGGDVDALEKRFATDHSMLVAPATREYLRDLLAPLEAVDMLLTDANGYNAVITNRSADFVQSDEEWWRTAWRDGVSVGEAKYDSASRAFTVELSTAVTDAAAKVGVLKLKFSVVPLAHSLAAAGAGVRVDVIDAKNRVLLSSDSTAFGNTLAGVPAGREEQGMVMALPLGGVDERAAVLNANSGEWRIVAHQRVADIAAPYKTARAAILAVAIVLVGALLALILAMDSFLQRRIAKPARDLAEAAEAVAAGDFSIQLKHTSADDEIGRLTRAVGAMILELRRLAQAISGSAKETNEMSSEISAGAEEMAATAGEIANTASDLSAQATKMAETITSLAGSASALQSLAVTLDTGAREGVSRNTTLRTLALENRAGLDASAGALSSLADDVHGSAASIAALGTASEEIRSFVTLVRKLARQSKLLALNAAMEAARAGVHGQGFAVVASEVRRLAAMSSDAAEQTETIVKSVLEGIAASRASTDRAVGTAEEVRAATSVASVSFSEIEAAVADSEAWTATIAQASTATTSLVGEITERLQSLAGGTESFAAAMEEVAASSEEQSASTQEIAGAANALGAAAEKLSKLVGGLRTEG